MEHMYDKIERFLNKWNQKRFKAICRRPLFSDHTFATSNDGDLKIALF